MNLIIKSSSHYRAAIRTSLIIPVTTGNAESIQNYNYNGGKKVKRASDNSDMHNREYRHVTVKNKNVLSSTCEAQVNQFNSAPLK